MKTTILLPLLLIPATAAANPSDVDSARLNLNRTIVEQRHGLWQLSSQTYDNPAFKQWRMAGGLTRVDGSYDSRRDSHTLDPRLGSREHSLGGGAETYTKYRNSTLWGYGRYSNGTVKDVVWNETADIDLVYPYIMADSIGGDIYREQYSFNGGYSSTCGRWAWGVAMSYQATLEYRDVDPRPRNVVGKLDAEAGVAYRVFADYHAGVSFRLRKYKQNNDIDFKSEMGVDKIFHMTGPAIHYNRFAGTALDTYYNGYRYGLSAELYPSSGKGGFLSCSLSKFTFKNILTGLNKLPLSYTWHKSIDLQAGWLHPGRRHFWGVSCSFAAFRRHGTENILGDATLDIYPQIGAIEMFADNLTALSATGRWGIRSGQVSQISMTLGGGWQRRVTAYVEPWRYTRLNHTSVQASVSGDWLLPHSWLLGFSGSMKAELPFDCKRRFDDAGSDTEMRQPVIIEEQCHDLLTSRRITPAAQVSIARPVYGRYTLEAAAGWTRTAYSHGPHADRLNLSLSLLF